MATQRARASGLNAALTVSLVATEPNAHFQGMRLCHCRRRVWLPCVRADSGEQLCSVEATLHAEAN